MAASGGPLESFRFRGAGFGCCAPLLPLQPAFLFGAWRHRSPAQDKTQGALPPALMLAVLDMH